MTRLFLAIYAFLQHRRVLRWLLLLLCVGCIGWGITHLNLNEDISAFMPQNERNERLNYVYNNLPVADRIIVRLSFADEESESVDGTEYESKHGTEYETERQLTLMDYADQFVGSFDSLGLHDYLQDVFLRVDGDHVLDVASFLTRNMPYFLSEPDYQRVDSLLNREGIVAILENNKKLLLSPVGSVIKANLMADPFFMSGNVLTQLQQFQISDRYQIIDDYIFSEDGKSLLLFLTSRYPGSETAKNGELAGLLEEAVSRLPDNIRVDRFGAALVAVSNASQIKQDSFRAMAIALVLIILLLGWFFRNGKVLVLIITPVLFGAGMAIFILFLIKGSLSAIALGTGAIILGIAVDYAMHYLIRLKYGPNPREVLKVIVNPMVIGNITTVGAFLSLLFISAPAMRDFGLFAACSLIASILFVLIFLPHLTRGNKILRREREGLLGRFSGYRFEQNNKLVGVILLFSLLFFWFSGKVEFETDMQKINYMTDQQREDFKQLSNFTSLGQKNIYHVAEGHTLQEALRNNERRMPLIDSLEAAGRISGCVTISRFLPSDSLQGEKLRRWNNFWEGKADSVIAILKEESVRAGFQPHAFEPFYTLLETSFKVEEPDYFSVLIDNLLKEYLIRGENRNMVLSLLHTPVEQAEAVEQALSGDDPAYLSFDTGSVARTLINILAEDFDKVLYICGCIVLLFLLIAFGRMELTLIAFLPMLLSWFWILGIMAIFGIHFNIVNIILATFIFGIGDDYTIFIVDGLMHEYTYRRKLLSSYKTAVALSALTMFIGIGTLIIAKHPAMQSLGKVTIIGMSSVVLITYVIPPLLFKWLTTKKGKMRRTPVTLKNFATTVYSFTVFLAGSLALTIAGFWLLKLHRPTDKRKLKFHELLCRTFRWVAANMPGVSSKITGDTTENFEQPGIIICNHQSHIDLVYLLMLSPKIIVLTNQWVWNSPFYGQIVRYADFYPITEGIENSVEPLRKLVEKGYSIAIFPEGTRSEDCSIKRFNRGAFYLAEKLQLDLIPILFHGIGHALPKSELLLRKGEITIEIMPRIRPDDTTYGNNDMERAKQIRQLFRETYKQVSEREETPRYFADLVRHNYIYKGADIERKAHRELKKMPLFEEEIRNIPYGSRVVIPACGIGVFALLCALSRHDLTILGIDPDEEQIALAEHCASRPGWLRFRVGTLQEIPPEEYDYIVSLSE